MRIEIQFKCLCAILLLLGLMGCGGGGSSVTPPIDPGGDVYVGSMVVLGANDLGMHCMNEDFSEFMILPPFNNLYAQVIRRGGDPQILNSGVTVSYSIPGNTSSKAKTNFWDYGAALFGFTVTPDVGLTGSKLSGTMKATGKGDFLAQGIPITPILNSGVENPYPLSEITVRAGGIVTARTRAVVPVSWEISCNLCHKEAGMTTGKSILKSHDRLHSTNLEAAIPVACGGCHTQPPLTPLGLTGSPALPTLSRAMHGTHSSRMSAAGLETDCYACHPGIRTKCQRDIHFSKGITCTRCHGDMNAVASPSRTPWVDEPACGSCHTRSGYEFEQPGKLFRESVGHKNVKCASCHGSPHAIVPSVVAADNIQSIGLQGKAAPLDKCSVCHIETPDDDFFHKVSD